MADDRFTTVKLERVDHIRVAHEVRDGVISYRWVRYEHLRHPPARP